MACENPKDCCGGSCLQNKLPKRSQDVVERVENEPVWMTSHGNDASDDNDDPSKCDKHARGVCCRELKGEDERDLWIDPDTVSDLVIGLSDGLAVPPALVAGLAGLGDSKLVILGGLSEVLAGSISMGLGGFLSSEAEMNHFKYLRRVTRQRVARSCAGEMEREVHDVLGAVGVSQELSNGVAAQLSQLEPPAPPQPPSFLRSLAIKFGRKPTPLPTTNLRWSDEHGLTAFLLKYGENVEEVPTSKLIKSALTVGMGYALGGMWPLLPFFFIEEAHEAFRVSILVTGLVLFMFGVLKQHFTGGTGGVGGYLYGGVSMVAVGGLAAGSAYGLVKAFDTLYALGVGSKASELSLVYENDAAFAALPTYPVVLNFKGDSSTVVDFFAYASKMSGNVPGLPEMDPGRILHGSQYCEMLKPLPLDSRDDGDVFVMKKRIVGVHENAKGIVVDTESTLCNGSNVYARMFSSTFNVGAKTGTRFSRAVAGPPAAPPVPARDADVVITEQTSKDQAALYRLSGDYNPLHIDPAMAKMAGFKAPILHGLATYGIATRALIVGIGGGDPGAIVAVGARFTSPVSPGDTLSTRIWDLGEVLAFEMKNDSQAGKVVLGMGYARKKRDVPQSKL
ncbi:hypothetical protein E3P89_02126 [Wallemia ichthyophaga]|uniref:MaoC-like domain-containing protein n=1 Tax=Wallemia ichthyophaga TaxID=245174 RepID=A0A4T0IDM3_WALIC|nr:hypothetical protein E3P90_01449 [Wallemia ichthyophaga]TIB15880.1 hypothetical protein E3P93_01200 [Wallemia ichthyophaga]TIB22449.1 hypothetical protein E3P89_02126 [Wallemia ichthyophaga]TIB25832.1 hypothetical protein E3P88_01404 [Wallemia ichthyophaga]